MIKETKMDILKDIGKLTMGITQHKYTNFKSEKVRYHKDGINLERNRWGECIYNKDELIQIRKWLRRHLKL